LDFAIRSRGPCAPVGRPEERRRPGRVAIDHQVVLGGLLERELAGSRALDDLDAISTLVGLQPNREWPSPSETAPATPEAQAIVHVGGDRHQPISPIAELTEEGELPAHRLTNDPRRLDQFCAELPPRTPSPPPDRPDPAGRPAGSTRTRPPPHPRGRAPLCHPPPLAESAGPPSLPPDLRPERAGSARPARAARLVPPLESRPPPC